MSDTDVSAHPEEDDEEPKVPRDENRPTADDPATENDVLGQDIDLDFDDTVEWGQTRAALEDADAGDLDTDIDLDGRNGGITSGDDL